LVIPVARRVFEIGPHLPQDLRFSSEVLLKLFLNNSHFMAVGNSTFVQSARELTYLILDKPKNQWISLVVPGNLSWNVRAFATCLTGMVDESLRGRKFRLSPGRFAAPARPELESIDTYLERDDLYRPGILFLYDVESRRYYQWETHQADSEIILVEGGQVYYRVDDAIYRASIRGKELGKPELVVEDDAVHRIHWAFFGPAPPKAPAQPRP
jgi:hypothetical protein